GDERGSARSRVVRVLRAARQPRDLWCDFRGAWRARASGRPDWQARDRDVLCEEERPAAATTAAAAGSERSAGAGSGFARRVGRRRDGCLAVEDERLNRVRETALLPH